MSREKTFIYIFNGYTLFIWLWLCLDFFTLGRFFFPSFLASFYLIILAYYATDKEIRRWRNKLEGRRHGEVFVYLWVLTLAALVMFYIASGRAEGYRISPELPTIAGTVMIIYIITDYLKKEFRK